MSPIVIPYGCHMGLSPLGSPQMEFNPLPEGMSWRLAIEPFLHPQGQVCWTRGVMTTFVSLLFALQCVLIVWFLMIIRVAWRVIRGSEAEDSRSEDEPLAEKEENLEIEASREMPITEVVGVEAVRLRVRGTSTRKNSSRRGGSASVMALPGHSDHKELLGRIGCDKGEKSGSASPNQTR
jgi:very-long-chain ceramide synthase